MALSATNVRPPQSKSDNESDQNFPSYPFGDIPSMGGWLEVAPGVRWIRMSLPFAPTALNVWAIQDGDEWTIVDTGAWTENCEDVWCQLSKNFHGAFRVKRVIVTHMHPDHVGMAGWLTRKFGVELWMTALEYFAGRALERDSELGDPSDDVISFLHRAGWSKESLNSYRGRFKDYSKHVSPLPKRFRRLIDGDQFKIGSHWWTVIADGGHSPEHACLYCPALKLLISGDQILPRISPNVSVSAVEPDANPMNDWLNALNKIRRLVPSDALVLPSHNECFLGLHQRIDSLSSAQQRSLEKLRLALVQPKRAIDVFGDLFARPIVASDIHLLSLATGESLACLNYLLHRNEIVREVDINGVTWYRAVGDESGNACTA